MEQLKGEEGMNSNTQAQSRPRGLACGKCGSGQLRVIYTRRRDGYIVRRRQCANCGTRMLTCERPAGRPDSPAA